VDALAALLPYTAPPHSPPPSDSADAHIDYYNGTVTRPQAMEGGLEPSSLLSEWFMVVGDRCCERFGGVERLMGT
jgi:hypothetical protein